MDTEGKLIEGCLAGKRKAQNELYKRFSPLLYGICLRYAANRFEAQDILQEGFIKVFSALSTFEKKGSFEGWVKRIVINNAINHIRRNASKHLFTEFSELENIPETVQEMEEFSQPDSKTMLRLIQELPDGYRMVFNLYVFEDYSHKEIAEFSGISENTSKTQLMRARHLLQKKISEL